MAFSFLKYLLCFREIRVTTCIFFGPMAVPCFGTKFCSEKWQSLTRRQISAASAMQSVEGNLEDLESRAFLSAVIPKLLSVLGNIDTTSQETSRKPTRGGSFAFKACILLIKSVKSLMNDGRFWESGLKSRELFNSCTTTKRDETEWIVSLVCKLRGNP